MYGVLTAVIGVGVSRKYATVPKLDRPPRGLNAVIPKKKNQTAVKETPENKADVQKTEVPT